MFSKDNPLTKIYGIEDVLQPDELHNPSNTITDNQLKITMSFDEKRTCLDDLQSKLQSCSNCRLGASRKNLVFGEGSIKARLMFVGEGPGADEDATGRPFVGRSGQLLTKMIEAMGLKRGDIYIANIVKCRPPENRNPLIDEADACIGNLKKQIAVINPEYIVCLGSVAVSYLLQTNLKISGLRGKWQKFNNVPVMPTYHPSYLLRSPNKKSEAWSDLQEVMKALGLEIKPKKQAEGGGNG